MMINALCDLGVQSMADVSERGHSADQIEHLRHVIEHAAHLLPCQGPITVFIHHNTLHAFEDLTFDQGVQKGAEIFGNHPYLTEEAFRKHLAAGRIRVADLQAVLRDDLGSRAQEPVLLLGSRFNLRMAMLQHPKWTAPPAELHWFVAQTDALTKCRPEVTPAIREELIGETRHWVMRDLRPGASDSSRPRNVPESLLSLLQSFGEKTVELWPQAKWEAFMLQALWRVIREAVSDLPPADPVRHPVVRPRDRLLHATGEDADLAVNEMLIRFCAAFLDQGVSPWPLPKRDAGFLGSFTALYSQVGGPPAGWTKGLAAELKRIQKSGMSALDSIKESLELLAVPRDQWDDYIIASFLSLRGWAGMIRQMEIRADRVAHPVPEGSLIDYLAVRLVLERFAAADIARRHLGFRGPLKDLGTVLPAREHEEQVSADQRAFLVFQLAQVLGWSPPDLWKLSLSDWKSLLGEIEAFGNVERRRIFQKAYERRYRNQALDAILSKTPTRRTGKPRFQLVCCLDEREESFRRHLEELEPNVETFGVAGFYAVAMYFKGAADAHFVPLCPIVVQPQHWVEENVVYSLEERHRLRARIRKAIGNLAHRLHLGSRTGAGGAVLTAGVGALATIPLVARVLFPRLTARIKRTAGKLVEAPALTHLELERPKGSTPSAETGHYGFTVDEMTNISERFLRDIGLTGNFADLVVLLGHGSNSVNNPHKSAYDCGACGGNAGGPNARASAQMLNDPRVRAQLAARGLVIPEETYFVGGFHNTCNDSVTYFDLDQVPKMRQQDFVHAHEMIELTCDRNAHERSRRFQSAPLTMPFASARRHVEARAEDLAQTRPECGHASNAICYVGRRERTRGIYMDRRAFLASYDPTQDDDKASILTRILQAAVPVCGGINLEYYFSYIDSSGWGCGTKLPHNVTALLGVMEGPTSDLRPGLPWQMVEIHEPVRLLFIVETTPEKMLRIMKENEGIGKLVRNGWVQMAVVDPHSNNIDVFHDGQFVPYDAENTQLPRVNTSIDWYRGWRENLGFALIRN